MQLGEDRNQLLIIASTTQQPGIDQYVSYTSATER